jgi:hypothetical protein
MPKLFRVRAGRENLSPPETLVLLDFFLPYTSTPMIVRGVVRNERGVNYGVEFVALTPYQQEVLERNCKVFDLLS